MTPLRQIETDRNFRDYTCGASTDALKHIVGVQFRNLATIGGSICGKFGFSDVSTLFLALDSTVELLKGGTVPLSEYLAARNDKDILLSVSVRKEDLRAVYNSVRNTATDFPILSMCMARPEGSPYRVSIGARPSRAQLAVFDLPADSSEDLSDTVLSGYTFGSNRRGSAEYREHLARVLLNRSLAAVRQ